MTLGVGEPFTATVRVAAYAALLLSLPLLLFQAYAFVLPAFSREERAMALPLMVMVPFLFVAGVVFAYYMVLPNAINFLQNFNDDNYDILLQAKDYYRFAITVLIAMGIAFQVPVGILAITRVGIVSTAQLRRSRRYAILVIAVVGDAAAGPGPGDDAVADGPALRALRGLYPVGIAARSARSRAGKPPSGNRPTTSNPDPCSSTSEAPVDAGPSRSSTSRSPS